MACVLHISMQAQYKYFCCSVAEQPCSEWFASPLQTDVLDSHMEITILTNPLSLWFYWLYSPVLALIVGT